MSDYLLNLAVRSLDHTPDIQPRLASLYEPERIPCVEIPESRFDEPPVSRTGLEHSPLTDQLKTFSEHARQTAVDQTIPTLTSTHKWTDKLPIPEAGDERHTSTRATRTAALTSARADITTKGAEFEDQSIKAAPSSVPTAVGLKANESHFVAESQPSAEGSHKANPQTGKLADAAHRSDARVRPLPEPSWAENRTEMPRYSEASRTPAGSPLVSATSRAALEHSTKTNPDSNSERVVNDNAVVPEILRPSVVTADETPVTAPVKPSLIVARPPSVSHVLRPHVQSDAAPPAQTETTVQVTIGRIEVRAVPVETRRSVQPAASSGLTSLDEYLHQRAQGDRR